MKIVIFGSGYVGLVTGACLADGGHTVTCVDVDEERVKQLQGGKSPIWEPGLDSLLQDNISKSRLFFTTEATTALDGAKVAFIAVGTPQSENGAADLQYVEAVATTIGRYAVNDLLIVDKSTVPVGTAEKVKKIVQDQLDERKSRLKINVCSNPEFLKEGAAISDFKHGERIVIGTSNAEDEKTMRKLYEPFNRKHDKIIAMDVVSAELTKYAANAMLATKISFMNEIAGIAEVTGADIEKIRIGIGSDSRIGYQFLYSGAGYGGSCFPKDVNALAHIAKINGRVPRILEAVEAVNSSQKQVIYEKLSQALGDLNGKIIAIWGLAFKPKTDDVREAPSQDLIRALVADGAVVQAYDPVAAESFKSAVPDIASKINIVESPEEALNGADALAIVTEWEEFRIFDSKKLKSYLSGRVIVDGRNLYNPEQVAESGFVYASVGRPTV